MENILFWLAVIVAFGLGAIMCWSFLARPAISRAYFNGGFDSFPEHFEQGRSVGFRSGYAYARGPFPIPPTDRTSITAS